MVALILDKAGGVGRAKSTLAGERDHLRVSFHDLRMFWFQRYPGLLMELASDRPVESTAAQLAAKLKAGRAFVIGYDVRRAVAALGAS